MFNFAVGLATIWALYFIGSRLFNRASGVLAAYLLSINIEYILHSTFALAESLLILFTLLAWFAMVRALQAPEKWRYWIMAGGLAGMTYLAKGTGPLIVVCFAMTATLLLGYKIWFKRVFWGFVGAFCLVSLPLWVFNWVAFGSPIFNSAINNVMWMDSAREKYVADSSILPTFSSYLQEKSLAESWERLNEGLLLMRYYFARLLWPTRSLRFDEFFQIGGVDLIVVLVLAGLLIFRRSLIPLIKRNRESLLFTAVLVIVFYLLFGWYIAISPFPIRFILPLAPMLFLLLSAAVVSLLKTVFSTPQIPQWGKITVGIAGLLLLLQPLGWFLVTGYLLAKDSRASPFTADAEFNTYTAQALRWVEAGHDDPVTVMFGPTHNLPVWRFSGQTNFLRTPVAQARTIDELEIMMDAAEITYVVVDGQMVDRMGSDNAAKWGISRLEDGRLNIDTFPTDWAWGFAGPEVPCQWCVFRRLNASPAIKRVEYLLDDSIYLFGYELDTNNLKSERQITVSLYWASRQPVSANYTVFTQLLGSDSQLYGQMDRQPLSGHWPTSYWTPGQKYVDKFVIEINQNTPPGAYTLLVGMYDLNTGKRLPVTAQGDQIANDAIPLVFLTMNQFNMFEQ